MKRKKIVLTLATIIFGTLLFAGIAKLSVGVSISEKQETSESGLHYKLPQLIPTTWIGRK